MFERSLLEAPPTHRWSAIVSITLQCSIAAAIVAVPLLYPATLVLRSDAPRLFLPPKPAPVPTPHVLPTTMSTTSTAAPSSPAPAGRPLTLISRIGPAAPEGPPSLNQFGNMGSGDPTIPGIGIGTGVGTGPNIAVVQAKPASMLRVSTGVSTGMLQSPIRPIYPRMAIATRTEGTVIVEAIISKSGKIESAHATAGPALLREAAVDAIRNARYSPYLLNGTPTEVQTTITVQFRLAS